MSCEARWIDSRVLTRAEFGWGMSICTPQPREQSVVARDLADSFASIHAVQASLLHEYLHPTGSDSSGSASRRDANGIATDFVRTTGSDGRSARRAR